MGQHTHQPLLWWQPPSRLLRKGVVHLFQLSRNTSPLTTRSMLSNSAPSSARLSKRELRKRLSSRLRLATSLARLKNPRSQRSLRRRSQRSQRRPRSQRQRNQQQRRLSPQRRQLSQRQRSPQPKNPPPRNQQRRPHQRRSKFFDHVFIKMFSRFLNTSTNR